MRQSSHSASRVLVVGLAALAAVACASDPPAPPVATPGLELGAARAPLGGPIDMTFRFVVADDAPPFPEDYRVLVHFVGPDGRMMWADDHDPPTPTTAWQPGQFVEYTRTEFLPIYPYVGPASIYVGLYDAAGGSRAPLAGDDNGQREYRVAGLELLPQTDNGIVVFEEGWHAPEIVGINPSVEWQWTRGDAAVSIPNPRRDVTLYLQLDQPGLVFKEPQTVTIAIGEDRIDVFTLAPGPRELHRIPITAAELGDDDMVRIDILVDKTFVPALLAPDTSTDARELGVRVFHLFVQPDEG